MRVGIALETTCRQNGIAASAAAEAAPVDPACLGADHNQKNAQPHRHADPTPLADPNPNSSSTFDPRVSTTCPGPAVEYVSMKDDTVAEN